MVARKRMTVAEFVELVENNPEKYFKFTAEGDVIEVTPKLAHSVTQAHIARYFDVYLDSGALTGYYVVTECAHDLDGWPCRPDVAIVDMNSAPIPTAAPMVAVEIKSDSNSLTDLREKARKYLEHGTKMVLLAYPEKRIIEVYQADADIQLLTAEDTLNGDDILPGFSVTVANLFPKMG